MRRLSLPCALLVGGLLTAVGAGCGTERVAPSDDGSGGSGPSEDPAATCAAQTTAEGCAAASADITAEHTRCVWVDWVEVTDAGSCAFGKVRGVCELTSGHDACDGAGDPLAAYCLDDTDTLAGHLEDDGAVFLGKGSWCQTRSPVTHCRLEDGTWNYPECACLCDESYPE